jgi:hypothetical protein
MIRSQIYSAAWRAAVALLSIEIAIVSVLRYFTSIEPPPPPILANAFAATPAVPMSSAARLPRRLALCLQWDQPPDRW